MKMIDLNSKREAGRFRLGISLPTSIVLLLVLCLTALSVLSFSAGKNDLKLTERTIQMTEDYYEAVAQSEQMLYQLNSQPGMIPEDTIIFDAGSGRNLVIRVEKEKTSNTYRMVSRILTNAEEIPEDELLHVYLGTEEINGTD